MDRQTEISSAPRLGIRYVATLGRYRALWDWLLAPPDDEAEVQVEAQDENHLQRGDFSNDEGTDDAS